MGVALPPHSRDQGFALIEGSAGGIFSMSPAKVRDAEIPMSVTAGSSFFLD
jgi:hypothetical protein